jgi:DNA polymerase III subunit alpha
VGPGRGSAAGCLVAYVLGITDIDPLAYNLIFERFLNPDRISMPDIDMDFCYDRRPEVIEYVSQKYGVQNVAQIITFGTMGAKAAIRDVGRVLGIEYNEVDKIAKLVPNELNITLQKAMDMEPRLKEAQSSDPRLTRLFEHAFVLEGLVRNASTHAAGVVISEEPLTTYVPLCRGSNGETTTQFQMGDLEKIGLLKMDFLGLKTLTVINETLKIVARTHQEKFEISEIPLDDAKTFELLNGGKTVGIFQLESGGMQDLARRIGISGIDDVVALVALFRPGPMHMLEDFIKRKQGKEKIQYDHPLLEPILKDTYGIMLYQEQVMKCANVIAGYSLAQADTLRRIMGKKIPTQMEAQKGVFIEGAAQNKVPKKSAEKIFETMAYFAGYGFNKSHSAAYGLISYQTAFLKAHYPAEYMAALLSSELNNTDKISRYIRESSEMGMKMLPPDVNESYSTFTVVGTDIRFGLAAIKNVGKTAVLAIQDERMKGGRFKDIHDFLLRVDARLVNRKVLESLIKCGAFDSTNISRFSLFTHLDSAMNWAAQRRKFTDENQGYLFEMSDNDEGNTPKPQDLGEWPQHELLANEKELLGFYVTGHPLEKYRLILSAQFSVDSSRLTEQKDNAELKVAGLISKARHTVTKRKSERMAILVLEDLAGSYEVLVFPQTYARCRDLLEEDKAIVVKGRVSRRDEKPKIIAEEISLLENVKAKDPTAMQVRVQGNGTMKDNLEKLRDLCVKAPGGCRIYLQLNLASGENVLLQADETLKITPTEAVLKQVEALFGRENIRLKV